MMEPTFYQNLYSIYIDRAFDLLRDHCFRKDDDALHSFLGVDGDLERVYLSMELGKQVNEVIGSIGNMPMSYFCYNVLESNLSDYLQPFVNTGKTRPSNDDLVAFVQQEVKAKQGNF